MLYKYLRKKLYIFLFACLVLIIFLFFYYIIHLYKINQKYYEKYNNESPVTLRKFPYPYKAALSICSDIDNTETLEEFLEIKKFLNTKEMTSMGKGLGLEIGNSFFFYEPPNESISYFNSDSEVQNIFKSLIKNRKIDVIHSYGKKIDFTREDAVAAVNELKNNNLNIDVWVDHTKSIDNFGDDVTFGQGDHLDSIAYHADLTLAYGIKFVWLGRVTMIVGQAVPISFETFFNTYDPDHPIYSLVNISKEFAKNYLAVFGNKKYVMHKENDLVRVAQLDDDQNIYEFIRFDNYWKGVGTGADNKGLAYSISSKTLNRLKDVGGYMIVYTHFGKNSDCEQHICKETQDALLNLAKEYYAGNIYVTTTSKLLNYYVNSKYLNWSYEINNNEVLIYIHKIDDPVFGSFIPNIDNLQGISFYVPNHSKVKLFVNNKEIKRVHKNNPDCTKRLSVMIPIRN